MAPVSDRGGGSSKGRELSLDDCRCPVCLEIFIEPVTLPCTHTFCKECFLETVDKATLCCPMCRKRVSTWARLNSRNNTLVDQQLWTHIQTAFPLQCQRRLSGQDAITEDEPGVSVCFPRVSQPGELKREYEDQVTKLTEEKRAMEEEEQRASEEYIQRLLAEEEELLQEERRRREDDEQLARLLSNQLNSNPISQDNLGPADVTPAKKKKKDVSGGQMDKFLCPLPSNNSLSSSLSSSCSFVSNKENILVSQVERPLPNLDYYGPQRDRSEPPSVSMDNHLHPGTHRSHVTGDKRKSSELDMTEDEEETVIKQGCLLLPSSSSSSSSSSSLQVEGLQGVSEWEVEQLRRRQQEEDDRRLALLLQKELDQEEKQRATDRRKDSSDPYLLRPNSRGKVEDTGPDTPSRKTSTSSTRTPTSSSKISSTSSTRTPTSSSKTSSTSTRTSIPSSKTSSASTRTSISSSKSSTSSTRTPTASSTSSSRTSFSRGSKQATLTEMFSSLIS